MDNKKNIVLIGMMGAGKSTIAHLISQKLEDFYFLDIDKEIEHFTKRQIAEIFAIAGEEYFREIEYITIQKFSNYHNQIIATGGGVVENEKNLELLRKHGVIFYLSAKADELYQRVSASNNRPLLQKENPQKVLKELLKRREPLYKTADFEINTENKTIMEIVEEIIEKYESVEQS